MQLHLFAVAQPAEEQRQPRSEATCEVCGATHGWRESLLVQVRPELRALYRRVCAGCRLLDANVVKLHHLDAAWALRLITATRCELCDEPFARGPNGRPLKVIDHNHACCPGRSCGRCVRGVLCGRCNFGLAGFDRMGQSVGIDSVLRYLRRSDSTVSG